MSGRSVRVVLDRSLTALAWRCHPDGCPRERTCCGQLVPEVSRREMRVVDGLMDELARLVPALREGRGYASVFVADGRGGVIESGDDGTCPFLYRTRRHARCAIHTVALATGRPLARVKPASCRHWPLAVEPAAGGRVRLTVDPAARQMGCVAPAAALPGKPRLAEAFREEIREIRTLLAARSQCAPAVSPTGRTRSRRRTRAR